MIEILSESRCTGCNICVSACPTNVFEAVEGGIPRIAKQDDCQTCFMCELYSPADALFVAPQADAAVAMDEARLPPCVRLGSFRGALRPGPGLRAAPAPAA